MSNAIDDMHTELVRLRAQNAKMLKILKVTQTYPVGEYNAPRCQICGGESGYGGGVHYPDCKLAALIKECGRSSNER